MLNHYIPSGSVQEERMMDLVADKGLEGDDSWAGSFDGASTMVNKAVILLIEDRFDCGRVEVLAPIAPDERGTKIPISKEPRPVSLPKTASKEEFQAATKSQSDAILAVYNEAGIDIASGERA
mgnify:CR=1 FL=1